MSANGALCGWTQWSETCSGVVWAASASAFRQMRNASLRIPVQSTAHSTTGFADAEQHDAERLERVIDAADGFDPPAAQRVFLGRVTSQANVARWSGGMEDD